jgi:hypothetical protein
LLEGECDCSEGSWSRKVRIETNTLLPFLTSIVPSQLSAALEQVEQANLGEAVSLRIAVVPWRRP